MFHMYVLGGAVTCSCASGVFWPHDDPEKALHFTLEAGFLTEPRAH